MCDTVSYKTRTQHWNCKKDVACTFNETDMRAIITSELQRIKKFDTRLGFNVAV